jgi:transcriptional regulator with XRE-family HTH domain
MGDAPRREVLARKRVHRLIESGRLRQLREGDGLPQADVARFVGVSPSNVSRWEAGLTRPTGEHALALLELFDGDGS